jgi:signal transduction histidine kinase
MAKLIEDRDWAGTPLGPIENWPDCLVHTVNIILSHKFPNALVWGEELITIYNDAYRPLLGDKPEALGRPFLEVWPETRDEIKPQIDKALDGEPCYFKNKEFNLNRYGKPEKAWFDYCYCPVRDEEGNVLGILNTAVEKTDQIKVERELKQMNETLEERVKERTAELKDYQNQLRSLAFQLNQAEEQERHRLAAELHDNLGQLLALCKIKLSKVAKDDLPDKVLDHISDLEELIVDANRYTSELVSELKPPPIVQKEGIEVMLSWIARRMEKHGLNVTFEEDGHPKPLSEEVESILYQSVRELLFNVVKHANACEARLQLSRQDNHVRIIVEDSGKGFDMEGTRPTPTEEGGFGLFNIQERISVLGGNLEIDSEPGEGTKVILYVPLMESSETSNQVDVSK